MNSWGDFQSAQFSRSRKSKGDAFELLCKYYFQFHPKNEHIYRDHVWLLKEVPERVKQELGLGEDVGFDLLLKDKQGNYIPVQCKYHSDPKKNLTWEEASTFFGKYYSNNKYQQAYLCTSAYGVSRHYEDAKTKPVIRVMGSDFQSLDKDFFDAVRCELEGKEHSYEPYKPRAHQEKAIKDAKKHFLKDGNNRGKLIFPCGSGKSLTGFWLAQELKAESVVVAVPSLSLVKQTLDVYLREIVANKKSVEWLCICSEADIGASAEVKFEIAEIGVPCTTNPDAIKQWLERTKGSKRIIFTTYQSGRLIGQISKALGQSFDLGIFDEAHKTVGSTSKLFSFLLFEENINIHKRVFMTATERFYSGSKDDIVSMDDADIYGEVFTQMSFKDAIEQDLLTDYKVITIDVSKAEIAGFIRDNKMVELSKEFGKEAEARSLASMLALRKAMKRFGIKNAVSFHSSIRKAKNASQIQDYITKHYDFKSIDSYTVDGGMSTGKREVIINEFAASSKALITNARCLTEGVDVPNIDCIVFADPRRSKIDIVQALGRALRKKEGKDWGYVILPVVYNGDSHEIDNDNFKEIVSIIRGLAANDERIIEHFKDKQSLNGASGGGMTSEQFMFLTGALEESEFQNQIGIKIWEGLSRFKFLSFKDAKELVKRFEFKSTKEFNQWNEKTSHAIPSAPHWVYKDSGWISYPDFLGNQNFSVNEKDHFTYSEAKNYLLENGISTHPAYISHLNNQKTMLPRKPDSFYQKSGWIDWDDFFSREPKQKIAKFSEARSQVRSLNLKSRVDFWAYHDKLNQIPLEPHLAYRYSGWLGWSDFLGSNLLSTIKGEYLHYIDAKQKIKELKVSTKSDYNKLSVAERNKYYLPGRPNAIYKNQGWKGWDSFLGKKSLQFLDFDSARRWTHSLGLDSVKQWNDLSLPEFIPTNPQRTYKNQGWISWGDWLGSQNEATRTKQFLNIQAAKELIAGLGIQSETQWRLYKKRNKLPEGVPRVPEKVYAENGWKGWKDFLGTDKAE